VAIGSSSVPGAVANILTGGAASKTNAGTYAVTADFVPNDGTNYNSLPGLAAGDFVIQKAALTATLTAGNKTYDGTDAEPNANMSCALTGVLVGDAENVTCASSAGTFNSSQVGAATQVTATVTIGGSAAGNYTLGAVGTGVSSTSATAAASITTKPIIAALTAHDKAYNASNTEPDANMSCALTGVVASDVGNVTCAASSGTFNSADVATANLVTATETVGGAAAGNYTLGAAGTTTLSTSGTAAAHITLAPVTATAGSGSAPFDGSTKTPSACAVTGTYIGNLSCTNNPASVGPAPGTTTITPVVSGTGQINFNITPVNGSYTIIDQSAPIVSNTAAPPVAINTAGTLNATISDATTGGSKIVSWYFKIDNVAQPVINILSGSQAVTVNVSAAIPATSAPDVREICVYGTDAAGNTNLKMDCALQAVYDPSAGFVTGGGWIMTPAGSYTLDPSLSGKATFGFVSKYLKGANTPTGNTEFQFHAAGMNFSSTVYEWLVVSGSLAQYKGSGTINGSGNYGFILTATDGQLTGGGGTDKFRIKITNKATGTLVYDNNFGATDTDPPTTVIGGGSIQIKAK
jgi:hypothetical protein